MIAAIISLFFASVPAVAESSEIHWFSYDKGIKKMKAEHKKGYIHFYTKWCTYCKIMEKKTFTNKRVIDYLNKNFVPIRINAQNKAEIDLVRKYAAYRYPGNYFINADGSGIGSRPGFIPPDLFLSILKYINTENYKKMSFSDYMKKNK